MKNFDEIWGRNMGDTYEIEKDDSCISNGLSEETARAYEEADSLTDEELWEKMQAGEL